MGALLRCRGSDLYSVHPALDGYLTLFRCNREYGTYGGCKYGGAELPEFDQRLTKGCVTPLKGFDNSVGHFVGRTPDDTDGCNSFTVCFGPELVPDV